LSYGKVVNKISATEMDMLRRSARKSRLERIKNEHIKEIMGVKEKPDIIDIIEKKRLKWYGHVKKDARGETTKINYGVDTRGEKKKRTSKKTWMEGVQAAMETTSRSGSVVKQKGMVFGFWKTATAVVGPEIEEEGQVVAA
jgi:hypothetical protein